MDNGGEFKKEFTELCDNMGMKQKSLHPWNLQSNAILEIINQVFENKLQLFDLENMNIDPNEEVPFNKYLQLVAYTIRSAYHQTYRNIPAQMVFGGGMFLPIDSQVYWEVIYSIKQELIFKSNEQENPNQIDYKFNTGYLVIVKKLGILPKLRVTKERPFKVTQKIKNRMITIEKKPFVPTVMKIIRVKPHFSWKGNQQSVNDGVID